MVERLLPLEREIVPRCNICSSNESVVLARRDRYGFPVRTALCWKCGLVYLVDRFTASSYSEFYGKGDYRVLTSLYNGSRVQPETLEAQHASYAQDIISLLAGHVLPGGGSLLDVGGGNGGVAERVAGHFGLRGTVLDPAASDVVKARQRGLDAFTGTVEDWKTENRFDVILLCQTIEHLFDLRMALDRIRSLLTPQGLFYCDIVDFTEACRHEGPPEVSSKIDHCFWLWQEAAPTIFRSVGFEVVSMSAVSGPDYVGFLLRPCAVNGQPAMPEEQIHGQLRRLRELEAEWYDSGKKPDTAREWLRRKAYRTKRNILRMAGR